MIRIVIALLAAVTMAQGQSVVGRWRSVETSKGGIGAMFEFRADGTLSYSPGAIVEMNYRIEDDQLILPSDNVNGPEQRQSMRWVNPNRLVLQGAETLTRQGTAPDASNPILGEWTAPREMGGVRSEVRWLFQPEGKALFLFPFSWQKGRYNVKGAMIRIERPNSAPAEGAFRIEGDVLTIPGARGGESRFKRY